MSNYGQRNFIGKNEATSSRLAQPSSKFEVGKTKRKSLIPLRTANPKSHNAPFLTPQSTVAATGRKSSGGVGSNVRRNYRSVHSSTVPTPEIGSIDNVTDDLITANHSEGSLISVSSVKLARSSEFLLEWKDNRISIKIDQNDNSTLEADNKLCVKNHQEDRSLIAAKIRNNFLVELAAKFLETARRTRGYFMCPICSEPFSKPAIIACGHTFCMNCVCSWFEDQDSCPCCRYHIVPKDSIHTLIAQQFYESGFLLASVFTAGNFAVAKVCTRDLDLISKEQLSGSQQIFLEFVASKLKAIHKQESQVTSSRTRKQNDTISKRVNEMHCFTAAIWFLRHGLQLKNIEHFPALLRLEAYHTSDLSREMFLKRIMTMKQSVFGNADKNASFRIPQSSLKNYSQGKPGNGASRYPCPRLRFRLPSSQSLGKILITCFIFFVIALAVHIFDDNHAAKLKAQKNKGKVIFYKMDFVVYAVTIFSMATLSETERLVYWRRRRRGNNNRRPRHQRNE